MKIWRVVLDTNVLVAASRSKAGAAFALIRILDAGKFRLLASTPLLLEYEAVLKRPEQLVASALDEAEVDVFLDALALHMEPVHLHYLWRPQLRDPGDEMVLDTALNGQADALVTFNEADFSVADRFGLKVLSPAAFLQQLSKEFM